MQFARKPFSAFFLLPTATPQIYTLSLHDALPISAAQGPPAVAQLATVPVEGAHRQRATAAEAAALQGQLVQASSVEHTSELQSPMEVVWRHLAGTEKAHAGPSHQQAAGPESAAAA